MATFSKRYKNTFFIAIQSKMMTWLRGLTANPALMIMTVSATSVKFGKSTNRMKSTKFWTMFTTSEDYCYKRLYQKVGLLGNESFKCFQTYPGYNVYVKKKMNEKTKFFIRYKHEQSRSAWNAFDATLAWITLKLARLKLHVTTRSLRGS